MKNLEIKLPGTPENADTKTVKVRKTGGKGKFSWRDVLNGSFNAGILAGLGVLQQSFDAGITKIDLRIVGGLFLGGVISHIIRKMTEQEKIIINAKELVEK